MNVLFILGVVLMFVSVLSIFASSDDYSLAFVSSVLAVGSIICISYYSDVKGQEKALKGQSDYIMDVRYSANDSTFTPVDTVFTFKTK